VKIQPPTKNGATGSKGFASFTGRRGARGRITNYRTGTFLEFLYNPTEVTEDFSVTLSEDPLPGASDPIIHFASGKAKAIKFQLQLCGESSLRLRGANLINSARNDTVNPGATYSIAGEIEFFQSFAYPSDRKAPGSDGGTDKVIFTLGRLWPGILCAQEGLSVKVSEWDPDLNPTRATLDLSYKRVVTETIFSNQVFSVDYPGYTP